MKTKSTYYLAFEWCMLFIGLPVVFFFDLVPVPKIAGLLAVTLVIVLILGFDESYNLKRVLYISESNPVWPQITRRSLAVAVLITALAYLVQPENLFLFPLERTSIWIVVLLLYPLLSALPQELIYREFFFHRYKPLFNSGIFMVVASAATFSFLHIIYDNWWAVGLSFLGGLLFARTYQKTKSLFWVTVEHAIYGCIVFTVGMGNYFYEPF